MTELEQITKELIEELMQEYRDKRNRFEHRMEIARTLLWAAYGKPPMEVPDGKDD